jgi:hypothetical protein
VELTEIADELYAQPPSAFTGARDEAVALARNAGDRPLATQLASLKRPTVGAWLVNAVALRQPEVLNQLFEAADAIRGAKGAAELRELSQRRRKGIDAVLAAATAEAARAGSPAPTRQQLAEAESTLTAAMADPETAEVVRAGRVLRALSYGGFGGLGGLDVGTTAQITEAAKTGQTTVTGRSAVTGGTATTSQPATTGHRSRTDRATPAGQTAKSAGRGAGRAELTETARANAEAEAQARLAEVHARVAQAQTRVETAAGVLADAVDAETEALRRQQELSDEIEAMRGRLDEADRKARVARQARLTAERDLASAKRRLDRAANG